MTDRLPGPRVLVVDDDEDDFVLASSLLSRSQLPGYTIEWAPSYAEGLRRLHEDTFDACLVDYRLGPANGVNLIAEAIAAGVRVPCILLTADESADVDLAGMQAGAADYLQKSALSAVLLERSIRYAMQHRRLDDQRTALAVEQAARHEAERANKAKDEFMAMLGHELRNPLGAMTNAIGLLGLPTADGRSTELARNVLVRQTNVMKRLIEDLLDVARMAHGKLHVRREPIDLVAVLRDALAVVEPVAREREQIYETHLPAERLPICGDATRLEQVFVNLLQNATKYTEPGGRVALSAVRDGAGHAVVTVTDTGIGMSSDLLARAFNLFVQQGKASGAQAGLGLGLALVRRIVELHDGEVGAASDGPGHGSTFTVRLPALVASEYTIP